MFGALLRVLDQLGRHPPIVLVGLAASPRAGDRSRDDLAIEQLHHRFGRRADDRQLGMLDEVHVRRRVDLAQHAVHVERVGAEFEVVALGEHDLEDVAGDDVLLRHLDGTLVRRRCPWSIRASADRRRRSAARPACRRAVGRGRGPPVRHARPQRRTRRRARRCPCRACARSRSGRPAGASGRTPPASRSPTSRRRDSHGRRSACRAGARPRGSRRSRGSPSSRRAAAAGRRRSGSCTAPAAPPSRRGSPGRSGCRPAAGRRVRRDRRAGPASPTGSGRRRRSGPTARRPRPTRAGSPAVADELGVRGDRGLEVGEQLGPDRDDAVLGGVRVELLAGGSEPHPNDRKKQVRSPVWQAPAPSCSTLNSSASASQS